MSCNIISVHLDEEFDRIVYFESVRELQELFHADEDAAWPYRTKDPVVDFGYFEGKTVWLALDGRGAAVGLLVAEKDDYGSNYSTCAFYVSPEHRGNGVGTSLFRKLSDHAESEGCGLELLVRNDNVKAKRLYYGFGLKPCAELLYRKVTGG
ncbi:MAG: GNAT family N-acetyltransferase [Deltaproteobacteria bacterium]|jgi:ribosomal protein S18 acetylase RimI-like enzyme|nr:GNAT family N-acetyltransferase [Deltaproteobacteria bacterium]